MVYIIMKTLKARAVKWKVYANSVDAVRLSNAGGGWLASCKASAMTPHCIIDIVNHVLATFTVCVAKHSPHVNNAYSMATTCMVGLRTSYGNISARRRREQAIAGDTP